jgi:mRNA interferase HigB
MLVNGRLIVERYLERYRSRADIGAARRQFDAWFAEAKDANWRTPADLKRHYRTASILKSGRVVFNISGNRYGLVVVVAYAAGVVDIRFFGAHAEYDRIDAEKV